MGTPATLIGTAPRAGRAMQRSTHTANNAIRCCRPALPKVGNLLADRDSEEGLLGTWPSPRCVDLWCFLGDRGTATGRREGLGSVPRTQGGRKQLRSKNTRGGAFPDSSVGRAADC